MKPPEFYLASPFSALGETTMPLRVVIAHDDMLAGQRAIRLLASLAWRLGNDVRFEPRPWPFHLLADAEWREVAAGEAAKADLLVIAAHSPARLSPVVERWMESTIARLAGREAAVVALLGTDEHPAAGDSPGLLAIQAACFAAGLACFAPGPGAELDDILRQIHERAELVTPLLQGILNRSRPASRWEQSAPLS